MMALSINDLYIEPTITLIVGLHDAYADFLCATPGYPA